MKTTEQGRLAEAAVAKCLADYGHELVAQNWRTRHCEVDLITKKDGKIYFTEVKYRASAAQGDGFEYITPSKLKQMTFAAESWVASEGWSGDYVLQAAAVSGLNAENIEILEID